MFFDKIFVKLKLISKLIVVKRHPKPKPTRKEKKFYIKNEIL